MLKKYLVLAATLGLLTIGSAQAATMSFTEGVDGYAGTDDTWLRQGNPNRGYGAFSNIQFDANATNASRWLLRYDISTLGDALAPGQSIIVTSATITLTQTIANNNTETATLEIRPVADANADWVPGVGTGAPESGGGATWLVRSQTAGSGVGSEWAGGAAGALVAGTDSIDTVVGSATVAAGSAVGSTVAFNLDAATVQGWIAGTNGGVFIDVSTITNVLGFGSSDNGTIANRPTLSVTFDVIPEPGSLALFSAAAGLCLVRRKKRVK